MSQYRPPGVHVENEFSRRYTALSLHPTGIPGFLGLAQKGPVGLPVRITSMEAFAQVFGKLDLDSYLEPSVRGFFDNGGRECYVVRIAHQVENGPGMPVKPAMVDLKDGARRRRYVVMGRSEGAWANGVRVSVSRVVGRLETFLIMNAAAGDERVSLKSVAGLTRGTCLRIYDDEGEAWHFVREAKGKEALLDPPLSRAFKASSPTYISTVELTLTISTPAKRETFRNLSVWPLGDFYLPRVVNERSSLALVQDLAPPTDMPDNLPVDAEGAELEGGEDGITAVTPADFIGSAPRIGERNGLLSFEDVPEVDLLVAPDLMWCHVHSQGFKSEKDLEIVQQEILSHCERMRDRFAILDMPPTTGIRPALQWRKMFDSAYGAFYYPWVTVYQKGDERRLPPSGFVAGVYARMDNQKGVFHPPANQPLEGVVDLDLILHDRDLGEMNREGINCLKYFPSRGIRVWGARTVSSDPQLRYVNVRRELNSLIKSLSEDLHWVVFEPNNESLWKRLTMNVQFFLFDLWKAGHFRGSSPEEAFFVKCDDENNPEETRRDGQIVIDIGVSPVRPAEFVTFSITQSVDDEGPGVGV
jgi:uncharacterized protein